MGTSLIEPRKRGANIKALPMKMRDFCLFLIGMTLWEPVEAARQAGYKAPNQAATKLMKDSRIQAFLGKKMREREERCLLKADDVLNYLRAGLFFNPLRLFQPTKDGKWLIQDPNDLPEEVGRLIEKMKVKVVEREDGSTESVFEIELISKATLLPLAMKHLGIDGTHKVDLQGKISVDWDSLYDRPAIDVDSIEQAIEEAEE